MLCVVCTILISAPTGRSCEPLREDELAAGDNVKIELEWEVLKMMQEKHGGWNDVMIKVRQS